MTNSAGPTKFKYIHSTQWYHVFEITALGVRFWIPKESLTSDASFDGYFKDGPPPEDPKDIRIEAQKKIIADKDKTIAELRGRVTEYERSMQYIRNELSKSRG